MSDDWADGAFATHRLRFGYFIGGGSGVVGFSLLGSYNPEPCTNAGSIVRNMMATADGNLVLACSGVNRVALLEVKNE